MDTELSDLLIESQRTLPEGWQKVKLGELATKVGSGVTPKGGSKVYRKNGIPLIRSQNVLAGHLKLDDVAYISEDQHQKMKFSKLQPMDVLLNITGASIGRSCVVPVEIEEGNVNQHVCIIRTVANRLNPNYLDSFLQSLQGQAQIDSFQAGGNRQGLNYEQVRSFAIPLPPLPEQQRIAAILTKWDEGIEKLQAIIAKTRQRKAGLMQQLLTGTKRFAEFEEHPWETVRFGDVFSYVRNESHSRDCLTYEETENQVYYVHYGDIHATFDTSVLDFGKETRIPQLKDEIVLSKQSAFLQDGDLLIADASEDYEGIGECVEVKNLGDKVAVGGLHTIIARDSHNLTVPGFRNYLLMHPEVAIAIRKVANGISVYGLSKTALSNTLLYLPSLAEQRRIAAVLSAADLEIEGLTQELNLMQNQKRGLMQGLLTGDISVKTITPQHHD